MDVKWIWIWDVSIHGWENPWWFPRFPRISFDWFLLEESTLQAAYVTSNRKRVSWWNRRGRTTPLTISHLVPWCQTLNATRKIASLVYNSAQVLLATCNGVCIMDHFTVPDIWHLIWPQSCFRGTWYSGHGLETLVHVRPCLKGWPSCTLLHEDHQSNILVADRTPYFGLWICPVLMDMIN